MVAGSGWPPSALWRQEQIHVSLVDPPDLENFHMINDQNYDREPSKFEAGELDIFVG